MNRYRTLILVCILSPFIAAAQRSIVVLGSSTAAGGGASTYPNSWVGRTTQHYIDLGEIDVVYNLAVSGWTTLEIMPTDSSRINPDSPTYPKPENNVSKAISFSPLPKLVIISMPSNDLASHIPFANYLGNLRLMYNFVTAAGIPCIITSTQPRDDIDPATRELQREARDSILAEFPRNSLDFWDTLTDITPGANYLGIKPLFYADGIHVNDAGHDALYNIVLQYGDLLSTPMSALAPLPLTLIRFDTRLIQQSALVTWTTADESGPIAFHIQRSADGRKFEDIASEQTTGKTTQNDYSWTDDHILSGKSFYRLRITTDSKDEFSRVAGINNPVKGWSIQKIYHPGGGNTLVADMALSKDMTLHLSVLNIAGIVVKQQAALLKAPGGQLLINLDGVAAGEYILRIDTGKGEVETARFLRF